MLEKQFDLTSQRLKLTSFRQSDIDIIVELANNYEIAKNLGRLPFPYKQSDAEFFLANIVTSEITWKVVLKGTQDMIGIIGLRPLVDDEIYELGFWYGQGYWGFGYATEAARAVIEYALREMRLNKLTANYFVANENSGRVLEKLGFTKYGVSKALNMATGEMLETINLELGMKA